MYALAKPGNHKALSIYRWNGQNFVKLPGIRAISIAIGAGGTIVIRQNGSGIPNNILKGKTIEEQLRMNE